MASSKADGRARYWKTAIAKHLRENPVRSLNEARAAIVAELTRLLEIEAQKQSS